MGLLDAVNPKDPRLQPGAIIALPWGHKTGPRMAEVIEHRRTGGVVLIEDCRTESVERIGAWNCVYQWTLVREAPAAPDTCPNMLPAEAID